MILEAGVVQSNGRLYGTTTYGGKGCGRDNGCGVIFQLKP
jgi:uncharacterized repeat protein (TIGR03803 family)